MHTYTIEVDVLYLDSHSRAPARIGAYGKNSVSLEVSAETVSSTVCITSQFYSGTCCALDKTRGFNLSAVLVTPAALVLLGSPLVHQDRIDAKAASLTH